MTHEQYGANGNGRHGSENGNGHPPVNGRNGSQPARLRTLYVEQLSELRAAERQAASIFPSLARVAADDDVASLMRNAATETEIQLARLEALIDALEVTAGNGSEHDPDGFAEEARTLLAGEGGEVRDLDEALLRSARKSLRYQIAGYESACATARRLGDYRTLDVLLRSLDEELATDSSLSDVVARRSWLLRSL